MAEDVEQQLKALVTQVAQRYKDGDDAQALALAQAAYELSQPLPHPDPLSIAASLHTLGERYRAMQVYEQALPLVHQALTLRQQALSLAHPLAAASMHTVGEIHQESLMAVDSVIGGYIRARTGDANAAREIAQETRLSLCGYVRAQTGDANATEEVTQEAFRAFMRAGFAKYDPAKGRLTTYAKGCAHLMLMRYYTAQQHRSRVTMLLSEFHTRYPAFNDAADTRDVLERLPEVATPSQIVPKCGCAPMARSYGYRSAPMIRKASGPGCVSMKTGSCQGSTVPGSAWKANHGLSSIRSRKSGICGNSGDNK